MNLPTEGPRPPAVSRPRRLTVAICTRNRADRLRQTLASFVAMAPPDSPWELVLVLNDCSDHTHSVAAEFAGRLPLVIGSEPVAGLSLARNRALTLASGDLIAWTDDDVIVSSGWLRAYEAAAIAHPEAAFFGGPIEPVFEGTPPPWLIAALPVIGSAFARQDVDTDRGHTIAPDRLPYGVNFAIRTDIQRKHPYDPSLGQAPVGWIRNGEETAVLAAILAAGGSGIWVGNAGLSHIIGPERQTLDYVDRYYEGFGRITARPATTPLARLGVWGDKVVADWRLRRAASSGDPVAWLLALQRAAIRRGRWIAMSSRRPAG